MASWNTWVKGICLLIIQSRLHWKLRVLFWPSVNFCSLDKNFSSDEVLQLLDRFFNLEMLVIWETQYLNYSVHCYVPLSSVFFLFPLCESTESFRCSFMRKCIVILHPYLQSDQIMFWLVPWNKCRNQMMMRRITSVKGMSFPYQRAFSANRNGGR
jgi:hypothetical protein